MLELRPLALLACLALAPALAVAQNSGYLKLDGHQDCMRVLSVSGLNGVSAYSIDLWVRSTNAGSSDKCVVVGSEPSTKWEINASCGISDVTFAEQKP